MTRVEKKHTRKGGKQRLEIKILKLLHWTTAEVLSVAPDWCLLCIFVKPKWPGSSLSQPAMNRRPVHYRALSCGEVIKPTPGRWPVRLEPRNHHFSSAVSREATCSQAVLSGVGLGVCAKDRSLPHPAGRDLKLNSECCEVIS